MYYVENYPEIKDNYYLKARNTGASRKLKGDIEIIVCFMKRRPTDFTLSTQRRFSVQLNEACSWLKAEAKKHGTTLNFKHRIFTIDTPEDADPTRGYDLIRKYFNSECLSMDNLQSKYEKLFSADEAPFLLVFDEEERSFAQKQPSPEEIRNECSVVFKDNNDSFYWTTIAHELLHQFGAIDYYYPLEVTEYARLYIKDSVMGIGNRCVLDDFTAYLVGIKDTISANTYHFLKSTMWMTPELYQKAINNSWKDASNQPVKPKAEKESRNTRSTRQPNYTGIYTDRPGVVMSINVSIGQIVKAGDVLATIGKGSNFAVRARVPGRVNRILVKVGDTVRDSSLIAVISRI